MRPDLTAMQVRAIVTHLRDALGEEPDEQLLLDSLEGQTDLFEMASALLNRIERDEGDKAALTEQMDSRKVRRDRCDARIKARREAIAALMECAGIDKLPLPEATLSLRTVPAKLAVNDASAVPEGFCVPTFKPSMEIINSAFAPTSDELPNWLRVEPEKPSLTIRRK